MTTIKPAAVAGHFYPDDPAELQAMMDDFWQHRKPITRLPKAIIAPHAGYIYSGAIATNAYSNLEQLQSKIKRIILLGPAHRHAFRGLAVTDVEAFATPLGLIKVDKTGLSEIMYRENIVYLDEAFALEHSLEVHLPFFQKYLPETPVLPILVGQVQPETVYQVMEHFYQDDVLIVVSSDLSHFHPYQQAQTLDNKTSESIKLLDPTYVHPDTACGSKPIKGLLLLAKAKGWQAEIIDVRNSGDTAGDKSQVVGYGAYHFYAKD